MSSDLHKRAALPVPDIRLGGQFNGIRTIAGVIGALCLILCVAGYFFNRAEFFHSYLFAYMYWAGFSVGGLGVVLLNNVVGGKWGVTTRSFFLAAARPMWLIALLFLPFLAGMPEVWPWANQHLVHNNGFLWHRRAYMNPTMFWIRAAIFFAILIWFVQKVLRMADAQDQTGGAHWPKRLGRSSAPVLLAFTFVGTFAYFDWVLSTSVEFYSTIYGALLLIGNVLQTFALTITVLLIASKKDRFGGRINKSLLHDLGNLMFAFTIFWTYLSVSQLIIIWPADLPQEVTWYLVRVKGGWKAVAAIISVIMFAIPFLALLSQARKQTPHRLIKISIWLLVAKAVDMFWVVLPTFRRDGFYVYWTDFAAFLGIGGLWVFLYLGYLAKRPLLPLRDPRVSPVVPEEAVA